MIELIPNDAIRLQNSSDIIIARKATRELAISLGLNTADQTRITTAVSEMTRNVLQYARQGWCRVINESDEKLIRIRIDIIDQGPGIPNIELAMRDGYSTSGGLGAGLPGTRRLMDEFHLESRPGRTHITMRMIRRRR